MTYRTLEYFVKIPIKKTQPQPSVAASCFSFWE